MARTKITPKVKEAVIERDGLFCRYCGHGPMFVEWHYSPKGKVRLYNVWKNFGDPVLELDHVIPVSRGGSNDPENLVVSCSTCNRRKWNRRLYSALLPPSPLSFLPRPSASDLGWRPHMADGRFW